MGIIEQEISELSAKRVLSLLPTLFFIETEGASNPLIPWLYKQAIDKFEQEG